MKGHDLLNMSNQEKEQQSTGLALFSVPNYLYIHLFWLVNYSVWTTEYNHAYPEN